MSRRIEKINALIARIVSEAFLRELSPKPGVFFTITDIDTSADLRYARVSVSVFPETEQAYGLALLENETAVIQKIIARQIKARRAPRIEFRLDSTAVRADEVEKIIRSLKEE